MAQDQPFSKFYDLDYFSGSQMFLYIGDVWIDEVTSLSYQTSQRKQPLYGYASQLFDHVAAGQVLVQGNFTINFKEQGYLWAVLNRFKGDEFQAALALPNDVKNKELIAKYAKYDAQLKGPGSKSSRPYYGKDGSAIKRESIERILSDNVTQQERHQFYTNLGGFATFDVDSPKDKQFESLVEVFEDEVWTQNENNNLNSQVRRTDHNVFDNFDMYVVFGDYGQTGDDKDKPNHTVQKIIGVHLIGQAKSINIDGSPIQEQYSFIAQSVA